MIYRTNFFNKFIKTFLKNGKYSKSSKILYGVLLRLYRHNRKDPTLIAITALCNMSHLTKVSSGREKLDLLLNVEQSLSIAFRCLSHLKIQKNQKSNYNRLLSDELVKAYGKSKYSLSNYYKEDIKVLIYDNKSTY